jgi:hypothetical protein
VPEESLRWLKSLISGYEVAEMSLRRLNCLRDC